MDSRAILQRVDHTILKAFTTWPEIERLCEEAIEYNTASVCIPPSYVAKVWETFGNKLVICTVIGFPLGYSTTQTKVFETRQAIQDGATEIDMVVNMGDVKNTDFGKVQDEIAAIKQEAGGNILKVIVETCYLSQEEKIQLCKCVTKAGADYIKTSTGFGTDGAQIEDIELFKKHIGPAVKIKASGGIRTAQDFEKFYDAGCQRIGASLAASVYGK